MKNLIHVLIVTPYGKDGQGGIDRLNDAIVDQVSARPELDVHVDRLVSRGQHGLFIAQFIFSYALVRLCIAALLGRVDLLHIHLSNRGSSYRKTVLGALARLLKIPYVVHLHGIDFREFWSGAGGLLSGAIDHLFTHSTRIIVMGRYWADVIVERLPDTADQIVLLPNATQARRLEHIPADRPQVRISFLGQLGPRKGTPQLIQALGRLSRREDWTAVIAGDGEINEGLEAVRCLGIADRVRIPGWLDTDSRDELLRSTDILVLPSFAENLPMVIVEAFAQGVAVISTPVGAVPEVINHGRNGLLVPPGNVEALADAIVQLIEDTELRQRLGQTARRDHAERYEIGPYVTRLVAIWKRAIAL